MADELDQLQNWIDGIMARVDQGERRALARRIAMELRKRNAQRIRGQVDPEGKAFAPRKLRLGGAGVKATSRRRGKMFLRAAGPRHLTAKATADHAEIGFMGNAGRIMSVHQYGDRDRVSRAPGAPYTVYPERQALGLPQGDVDAVLEMLLAQLEV